jgi:hypothetical protein
VENACAWENYQTACEVEESEDGALLVEEVSEVSLAVAANAVFLEND